MNRFPPSRPSRWLFGSALFYTVLLVLWHLASSRTSGLWQLEVTAVFGSWFYLPLWGWLLWALLRRHRRTLLVLMIPLLLFANDYGGQFLPQWPALLAASTEQTSLRVVSWNAYYRNNEPTAFVNVINELQPDVIAIQEINNTLTAVAQSSLQAQLPYQELYPTGSPSGMAILSRYPITANSRPDFQGCNCQEVTIDVNGRSVTILNMHPWPPWVSFSPGERLPTVHGFSTANQDVIVDALIARIEATTEPLIVLGDLNTSERQPNYWRMRSHLRDAFSDAGWGMGYTFPTVKRIDGIPVFPILRIDYIFHDDTWQTKRAWVGTIPGADHRYVTADLILLAD